MTCSMKGGGGTWPLDTPLYLLLHPYPLLVIPVHASPLQLIVHTIESNNYDSSFLQGP